MSDVVANEIYEAFRKLKAKDYLSAESILRQGLEKGEGDPTHLALIHSTLGVVAKAKGDFREAWREYEKAEKLLPDDPSLKIIMAKLLIDQFSQFDSAIKKLKQVLKLAEKSASYAHQAHAAMAIAYLKKGDRKKALEMFDIAMKDDFENIVSAENLNFEVIEIFLARNFERDRCRIYLEKALKLAGSKRDEKSIQFLTKLLESFEVTIQ